MQGYHTYQDTHWASHPWECLATYSKMYFLIYLMASLHLRHSAPLNALPQ